MNSASNCDHQRRVWRHPRQRTDPPFTIAHHTGPQPGVVVCSFDNRTPLVVIRGTLQHSACQTLPWSARSPDISPIDPVWDMMGRRLHLPGHVDELARQLEEIWKK
ncbi:transposable element Tc1 transposase [Trichonephila clavipes]|nr:transposable element Tc1 transposase [Trichonephila clavipes]